MNITSNYQLKSFNSRINNQQLQTNPSFGMKQYIAPKVTVLTGAAASALAGTILAIQNGNSNKVFTKQLIEQIFGNKEAFKLRISSEDGYFRINIDGKMDNKEYINLCLVYGDENTGIVKGIYYPSINEYELMDKDEDLFIASIMENLTENEQNLVYNSKLFNIERPKESISTIKKRVNDIIKNTPGHLFYTLPDTHLVHSSDLINPNELSKMKFGEDYLLMVHDTKAPGITALVKKEGLKCYSDINPQEAASHKKGNNDPDLIYFSPLSPDYNIGENCIVIAVRKGAGVVFNQEWRPAGYYEPYISLCNRFNSYHCFSGYKFNQSYGGITVPNIPEICYGDRHISPEYFVDINKLNSALIENNPNYNPAHTHKSPNSQSQSQNLQQVLTSLYNIFDK